MKNDKFTSLGMLSGKTIICVESHAKICVKELGILNGTHSDQRCVISVNWCKHKLSHVDIVISSDIQHLRHNADDIYSVNPNATIVHISDTDAESEFLTFNTVFSKNTNYTNLTEPLRCAFNVPIIYDTILSAPLTKNETFTYGEYYTMPHSRSDGYCAINLSLLLYPTKVILIGYDYGNAYQSSHKFKDKAYIGEYQYAQIANITNQNTRIINCSNTLYPNFDNSELSIALGLGHMETPPWVGSWNGETAVICSNGPSLDIEQCHFVNRKQKEGKCRIIAIKNSFSLFDHPDIVFTDGCTGWWDRNKPKLNNHSVWTSLNIDKRIKTIPTGQYSVVVSTTNNRDYSSHSEIESMYELKNSIYGPNSNCAAETLGGLCEIPGILQSNTTSGFSAINLAYHLGASKILLLGYDYSTKFGEHWFGKHEYIETKSQKYIDMFWVPPMEQIRCKTPILNCSTHTAIKNFKRASIYEELQ